MKILIIIILFIVSISLFLQTKRNAKAEREIDKRAVIIKGNILKLDSLKIEGLALDNRIDSLVIIMIKIEKKESK